MRRTAKTQKPMPRALIPNQAGFRLIVILLDDSARIAEVVLENGIHRLKDIEIAQVKGWYRLEREK